MSDCFLLILEQHMDEIATEKYRIIANIYILLLGAISNHCIILLTVLAIVFLSSPFYRQEN